MKLFKAFKWYFRVKKRLYERAKIKADKRAGDYLFAISQREIPPFGINGFGSQPVKHYGFGEHPLSKRSNPLGDSDGSNRGLERAFGNNKINKELKNETTTN